MRQGPTPSPVREPDCNQIFLQSCAKNRRKTRFRVKPDAETRLSGLPPGVGPGLIEDRLRDLRVDALGPVHKLRHGQVHGQ